MCIYYLISIILFHLNIFFSLLGKHVVHIIYIQRIHYIFITCLSIIISIEYPDLCDIVFSSDHACPVISFSSIWDYFWDYFIDIIMTDILRNKDFLNIIAEHGHLSSI